MSETKSEAFHRLATRRIEDIEDKLRIFSNLSNPGYEWTPAEVTAYADRIQAGVRALLGRFAETKRWRERGPVEALAAGVGTQEDIEQDDDNPFDPESPEGRAWDDGDRSSVEPTNVPAGSNRRQAVMASVLAEVGPNEEALLEMIAMQREVIHNLQGKLDLLRSAAPAPGWS